MGFTFTKVRLLFLFPLLFTSPYTPLSAPLINLSQGQPSGEAFIQMDSEESAASAAVKKHHMYMSFGKKQRYIEVFQCSIDDMNLILTGGVPVNRSILSSGK